VGECFEEEERMVRTCSLSFSFGEVNVAKGKK